VNFNTKSVAIRQAGIVIPPALIVDDVTWDIKDIVSINPSDVAQIDVLKGTNLLGMNGGGGVISVFTKTVDDYKNDDYIAPYMKALSPLGYQQPVEFYSPKYDTPGKRNAQTPDLRTTIHWQPVVQTDSLGVASFEFYTADDPASYTVIIEGLANDGSIIRQEGKLWVKDK